MTHNTEVRTSSRRDTLKWLLSALLIILAVVGNGYFSNQPLLYRVVGVVVIGGLGVCFGLLTTKGHELVELAKNGKKEIQRVVWPTRQETFQTTLIVMATILVVGLLLWLLDTLFAWLVASIIG